MYTDRYRTSDYYDMSTRQTIQYYSDKIPSGFLVLFCYIINGVVMADIAKPLPAYYDLPWVKRCEQ